MYHGQEIPGGRLNATEHGTHVPMFVYWPGKIPGGTVNDDLISFVDILPTMADVANIALPTTYGTLDGFSFYQGMTGKTGVPRDWIFCHYEPFLNVPGNDKLFRWVQNKQYKLYDSSSSKLAGKFFKLVDFTDQEPPLSNDVLTPEERALKDSFKVVLSKMHN
jgi:arylsulfatase A